MASASSTPSLRAELPPAAARAPQPSRWAAAQRLLPRFLRSHEGELDKSRTDRTRKDWLVDGFTFVCVIAFGVLIHIDVLDNASAPADALLVLDAVMLPISGVLLFWRRRWPFAVALALGFISILSPASGLACLVAAFALAAYAPQTRAFTGLGITLLSVPVAAAVWPEVASSNEGPNGFWTNVTFSVAFTAATFAWGLFAGARRQLLLSLEDRAARAESEQQLRVEQARQGERTRIAREMHDVLAHRMSLLSVHAGALEFRPDASPDEVARAAGVIRATAHEALEELRTVIGVMRVSDATGGADALASTDGGDGTAGVPEAPQPTLADVPHLVEEWRGAGARIELSVDAAALEQLPATVSRTAYRVVQESLTNAGKHVPNAKVTVMVGGTPGDTLTVSVHSALVGVIEQSPIPGTGLGLVGLRERTELVGGVFAAGIDTDLRRFVVEARLPWSAA